MPEYGSDILDDIAEVMRGQAAQFSSGQKRAPLTTASAGWIMPDRSTPTSPASGAHLFASGGTLYWRAASGAVHSLIPVVVPQASAVDIAANMTAGATAPASYDQDYVTRLRDDVREVREQLNALINSLRASTLLDT